MSDFPTLQPAMTFLVSIDAPISVGSVSKGTPLVVVPMTSGTLKSEPGFSPAIDAEFVGTGNDYIRGDPSGKHVRLDAHGVVKDKASSAPIYLSYAGVVAMSPEVGLVFGGSPDAKTTPFGDSFVEMHFETGADDLKDLTTNTFVAAGRFRVEDGKPTVVEYKISKVVKGN